MVGDALIRLLTFAGHAPELAADGHAAWKRLEHNPEAFDLLITDHQMPGLSGLELVRRLRTIRFPGKIMVYSSTLGSAEIDAYQALSVDLIVQKSVDGEVLLGAVESVCGRH